jgi:hypothetical protein
MGLLEIAPAYAELFRCHGLTSAEDFLACPGAIVGGHAERHVVKVSIGTPETRFFLKKEHRVPLRDRVASAWDGHGWVSKSVREGRLLSQARQAGIGCPEVAAVGEEGPRAFLLLCAEEGLSDLRASLAAAMSDAERSALARALGQALAELHRDGFDHPDLYAKHVLVGRDGQDYHFCFLDWQRSRRCRRVRWRCRYRDLAALDASVADDLASARLRLRCLRAYVDTTVPLARAAAAIRHLSGKLLGRRKIRDLRQAALPSASQQLVWLDDGRLCMVREFRDELAGLMPAWLPLVPPPRGGDVVERRYVCLPDGRTAAMLQRWQTRPDRKRPSPEYSLAATLFRLQRFGVATSRLLALGQQTLPAGQQFSFVLLAQPPATPFEEALRRVPSTRRWQLLYCAGRMLRQVHEAGYALPPESSPLQALALTPAGDVMLADAESLLRSAADWPHLAQLDLTRDPDDLLATWSRTDRLRFLLGYLNLPRLDSAGRRLVETLALQAYLSRERQVVP